MSFPGFSLPARAKRITATALTLALSTSLIASSATALPTEPLPAPSPLTTAEPRIAMEPVDDDSTPTDRFIVKFAPGVRSASNGQEQRANAYEEAALGAGVEVDELRETSLGTKVIITDKELGAEEADTFLEDLNAQAGVEFAERDGLSYPAAAPVPNDEYYSYSGNNQRIEQWALKATNAGINVEQAWSVATGKNKVIAIVDTGIATMVNDKATHPDLQWPEKLGRKAKVLPGFDVISADQPTFPPSTNKFTMANDRDGRDANASDPGDWTTVGQCGKDPRGKLREATNSSWHGTHVAGTAAATTGNGIGVAGVAPDASILPVRALGACGGYNSDIADGIIWAAGGKIPGASKTNPNRADVINLSIAGPGTCPSAYQQAINYAVNRGIPVVVAAGNFNTPIDGTGTQKPTNPANCQNVITVGASTITSARAGYSNYGKTVDVMAPGGAGGDSNMSSYIISTFNKGTKAPLSEEYYAGMSGTSMAAPHVAGTIAMMLERNSTLTPAAVEALLKANARGMKCNILNGCGAGIIDAGATLKNTPRPLTAAPVPTISGTTKVGSTLSAAAGAWAPAPVSLSYRWYRSGKAISGATSSKYKLVGADAGKTITVAVTGKKSGYSDLTKKSAASKKISNGTLSSQGASISGTAKVGSTLSAKTKAWGPSPVTMSYRWYRSGKAIKGATKKSYKLVSADLGKTMTVSVTGKKTGYSTITKKTKATKKVAKGTLSTKTVKISGKTRVGSTLRVSTAKWGPSKVSMSYRWYRSGKAIKGATKSSYKLVRSDASKTIKLKVTGKKAGYSTKARTSASTAKIKR